MIALLLLTSDSSQSRVLEWVNEAVSHAKDTAISVAVVDADGKTWMAAGGKVGPPSRATVAPNDRFCAGSTGKTFFAALAMKFVQMGKLSLDDKLIDLATNKDLIRKVPNGELVTIRQLLNHTSGVPEHVTDPAFLQALKASPDHQFTPEELIAFSAGKKALFEPGKGWGYADTNYILLAYAIECHTGGNAYQMIKEHFQPTTEYLNTSPALRRDPINFVNGRLGANNPFGEGYAMSDGKLTIHPSFEWAGGGFISNPSELAKWMRSLVIGDVLSPESRKLMQSGVPAKTGRDHQYGLGLQIRPTSLGTSYGHSGWYPGYLTDVHVWPDRKMTVCVMVGTDDQASLGQPFSKMAENLAEKFIQP